MSTAPVFQHASATPLPDPAGHVSCGDPMCTTPGCAYFAPSAATPATARHAAERAVVEASNRVAEAAIAFVNAPEVTAAEETELRDSVKALVALSEAA